MAHVHAASSLLSIKTILLLVSVGLSFLHGADGTNKFITPPPAGWTQDYSKNPVYTIGQGLQLEWEMNYTDAALVLWRDKGPTDYTDTNLSSYYWIVSYNELGLAVSSIFYFDCSKQNADENANEAFNSHYFFIVGVETVTVTPTLPGIHSTSSSGLVGTSGITSSIMSGSNGSDVPTNTGISTGQAVGATIGGLAGAMLIATVAVYAIWKQRGARKNAPNNAGLVPESPKEVGGGQVYEMKTSKTFLPIFDQRPMSVKRITPVAAPSYKSLKYNENAIRSLHTSFKLLGSLRNHGPNLRITKKPLFGIGFVSSMVAAFAEGAVCDAEEKTGGARRLPPARHSSYLESYSAIVM
ncbi:hypothetical protein B0H63DRAFT_560967 [Podospora didyma]|uniref:Mid2 domain-containing protein n=1 Tax=Podospora didyma TaxID=330526 RepID=A0AAE0NGZ5_9PEZI|nr:hypothetical protein B0H63DRAFT_560967 [Podospora didyma]